jgi:hypothetical protein
VFCERHHSHDLGRCEGRRHRPARTEADRAPRTGLLRYTRPRLAQDALLPGVATENTAKWLYEHQQQPHRRAEIDRLLDDANGAKLRAVLEKSPTKTTPQDWH